MPFRNEEGFSLIEVLAVAAVLGILMLPVFSMFTGASFSALLGGQETQAVTLAQQRMEELKGMGYGQLMDHINGEGEICLVDSVDIFQREAFITTVGLGDIFPGGEGEVILLEVTVSWGDDSGRSVCLRSYLGQRG
ncbi:MAG: type II secretion system protein [Bacillota bacterium]|nr:type II secretion system protein [Bacillota bacterium]